MNRARLKIVQFASAKKLSNTLGNKRILKHKTRKMRVTFSAILTSRSVDPRYLKPNGLKSKKNNKTKALTLITDARLL